MRSRRCYRFAALLKRRTESLPRQLSTSLLDSTELPDGLNVRSESPSRCLLIALEEVESFTWVKSFLFLARYLLNKSAASLKWRLR